MAEAASQANRDRRSARGIGLPATIDPEISLRAATAAEEAGFASFWLNNPPGSNALERLGRIARATQSIQLGVGVIPLSDRGPEAIGQDVLAHDLPADRFYLGIGSGGGPGGLNRVAEGMHVLRARLQCRIVVAALGPAMCRLAGAEADGVLFNWLTPAFAERSKEWVREGAEPAGRRIPRLIAYVRVALGTEAAARLRSEAERYGTIPAYAKHFGRMGTPPIDTAITADSREEIQTRLASWDGIVDEVVVRAIPTHDTAEDVLTILETVRPS